MSIPEFVLQKLIVPGSLKKTGNGFSFILNNTFAPATIQKFNLFVNSVEIPASSIKFSAPEIPERSANEITPENPILTPVGVEIFIKIENQSLNGVVSVNALTKEVGELVFSLADSKKKKKKKELKSYTITRFSKPIEACVTVNPNQQIGTAHPFLLGQFIEHLERCIYDGIWTKDGKQYRTDTIDLIKQLNPPIIRYPGGNFASGYHWEDGIGPREKRLSRHDAAWQAEESNQVGTDEFLAFCELIETEPLIVVNDGSGTPEEASRWVAYCNEPESTEQGRRRAQNGHPEPHNVKYWGIGNEVWGAWQIGSASPEEYTKRLLKFIKAMKAVDPEIKIIAVGNHPLTDEMDDPAYLWNKEVLEKAGDKIDYLSWHIYQPEMNGWDEVTDAFELFKSICAAPVDIDHYTQVIEKQISQFSPNKNVLQALDEWNVWLPPLPGETSMHQVTYTMRDALYVASALAVFYRNCRTMGMTNLAQMVNVLPLIKTNSTTAFGTAIFYPFILFNQMETNVIQSECQCPTFVSKGMGENILEHSETPWLDQLASISDDKKRITMILINRHPEKRMNVKLEIPVEYRPKNAMVLQSNHPLDANTFKNPWKVRISDMAQPKKNYLLLRPASVTYMDFERN